MNRHDKKWLDALRPYVGGGAVTYFRLADGSVDAVRTLKKLAQMHNWKEVKS